MVAGEASGDLLGASLMRELKSRCAAVAFIGVGGPRMQAEGLQSLFPMERLSVMGLVEVLGRLPELLFRYHRLVRQLAAARPDVLVGIDAPDFNLRLELALRRQGIRTVHYVSPSVWAWRQKRVLRIRQACDRVLALLPFEADFYRKHQVPVSFVGHPLADEIPARVDRVAVRQQLGLPADASLVALLPGSRGSEISRLAPLFLETAALLQKQRTGLRFVLPCASAARRRQLEALLAGYERLPLTLLDGQSHQALAACDAVLVASGTATLEAMLYQRPMVVAYRVAPLSAWLARRLIRVSSFSLPNLLAGQPVVPELIQEAARPEAMAQALLPLLDDPDSQTRYFAPLRALLQHQAAVRAAEAVLDVARQNISCS